MYIYSGGGFSIIIIVIVIMADSGGGGSAPHITKENIANFSYYELFGLPTPTRAGGGGPSAVIKEEGELRKRYRRYSLLFHPDKDDSDAARVAFERVGTALETLLDPQLREAYDETLLDPRRASAPAASSARGASMQQRAAADAQYAEDILTARHAQMESERVAAQRAAEAKAAQARQIAEELTGGAEAPFKAMEAALVHEWNIDEELLEQKEREVRRRLRELDRFYSGEEEKEEAGEEELPKRRVRGEKA